ncbi:MAG: MBOAT family O-acyltransferase [Chloroflexota bacterium]|nr:MBOAT family O-acyltransferase [Chloroflexota bacterium]
MSLQNILILIASALLIRIVFPGKRRQWALLVVSILAIYWLQPALPIRNMDFWLPTATVGLIFLSWGLTSLKEQLLDPVNWLGAGLSLGTLLLIGLTRFVSLEGIITPTRPPQFYLVISALLLIILSTFVLTLFSKPSPGLIWMGILVLLLVFIILKTPFLSLQGSIVLRRIMSQDPSLAKSTDLGWLGFSYVSFRLIHTLIDRMKGRLNEIGLGELLVYTIFYPTVIAGPIDRLQRFRKDLLNPEPLSPGKMLQSGERLAVGLFRKFILADALGLIAISGTNVTQVQSAGWLWLMLIAYAFQIFLDFAGYTDIAVGSGILLGFRIPENFNQPYLKPNLTLFWNNWHMTLTQWIRSYFFFPITRHLRRQGKLPAPLIILITQMSTMLIIGLWHGITLNFVFWGTWHGLGLFIHNRWSAIVGPKVSKITAGKPFMTLIFKVSGMCLTFLFVSLGWVWFALPTTGSALITFARLFGLGS